MYLVKLQRNFGDNVTNITSLNIYVVLVFIIWALDGFKRELIRQRKINHESLLHLVFDHPVGVGPDRAAGLIAGLAAS